MGGGTREGPASVLSRTLPPGGPPQPSCAYPTFVGNECKHCCQLQLICDADDFAGIGKIHCLRQSASSTKVAFFQPFPDLLPDMSSHSLDWELSLLLRVTSLTTVLLLWHLGRVDHFNQMWLASHHASPFFPVRPIIPELAATTGVVRQLAGIPCPCKRSSSARNFSKRSQALENTF